MKASKNYPKISPEEFRKSRDSIFAIKRKVIYPILMYRTKKSFEYNKKSIDDETKT